MALRIGIALVASWWLVVGAARAEVGTAPASCPGYVAHLRSARNYLAKGDRAAAALELRQAEQALDACAHGEAQGSLVGARDPSNRPS